MAYDEQSQIFGTDCTARANSGLFDTAGGVLAFLKLGIDPDKLVLGLPWYGYFYKCIRTGSSESDICFIEEVPFRGVNCSDAAGRQLTYLDIQAYVNKYGTYYDEHTATRYVWYRVSTLSLILLELIYFRPGSCNLTIINIVIYCYS